MSISGSGSRPDIPQENLTNSSIETTKNTSSSSKSTSSTSKTDSTTATSSNAASTTSASPASSAAVVRFNVLSELPLTQSMLPLTRKFSKESLGSSSVSSEVKNDSSESQTTNAPTKQKRSRLSRVRESFSSSLKDLFGSKSLSSSSLETVPEKSRLKSVSHQENIRNLLKSTATFSSSSSSSAASSSSPSSYASASAAIGDTQSSTKVPDGAKYKDLKRDVDITKLHVFEDADLVELNAVIHEGNTDAVSEYRDQLTEQLNIQIQHTTNQIIDIVTDKSLRQGTDISIPKSIHVTEDKYDLDERLKHIVYKSAKLIGQKTIDKIEMQQTTIKEKLEKIEAKLEKIRGSNTEIIKIKNLIARADEFIKGQPSASSASDSKSESSPSNLVSSLREDMLGLFKYRNSAKIAYARGTLVKDEIIRDLNHIKRYDLALSERSGIGFLTTWSQDVKESEASVENLIKDDIFTKAESYFKNIP